MGSHLAVVLAGPNGSGKSSITDECFLVGSYVNADEIQKELGCSALEAAQIATSTRERLLEMRQDFTFETVLSTERNIDLLARAKSVGYQVLCLYVLTVNPSINVQRVRQRVAAGGHAVDENKIVARYWRAMKLIPQLLGVCDRLLMFDNSRNKGEGGPDLIAEVENGNVRIYPSELWSEQMIRQLLDGQYSLA